MISRRRTVTIVAAAALAAVATALVVWLVRRPGTPREELLAATARAGLAERTLLVTWRDAAADALDGAVASRPPFRQVIAFDPARPRALAYRLRLGRGQRLVAWGEPERAEGRLLIELLETRRGRPRVVAASGEQPHLSHRVRRDGDYLLRIQPEPLGGGRWRLVVRADPPLEFPVAGRDAAAVISPFGASRDGGGRRHLGVDIAAPHGTPALAACDAVVTRVTEDRLGGRVVWLYSFELGMRLYYAHLDEQLVEVGDRVAAGARVGRVGTTGNATGGAPHLHFAVLEEAAIDPLPLIAADPEPPPVTADTGLLGWPRRTTDDTVRVRAAPALHAAVVAELPRHTAVEVLAARGDWLHLRLPDGSAGWTVAQLVEPARSTTDTRRLAAAWTLRSGPRRSALPVAVAPAGAALAVLATWRGHLLVGTPSASGWVVAPPT